jgi:hypothetical protein
MLYSQGKLPIFASIRCDAIENEEASWRLFPETDQSTTLAEILFVPVFLWLLSLLLIRGPSGERSAAIPDLPAGSD